MKNVLITGGAGFIGSALAKKLADRGFNIIVVDSLVTGKKSNLDNLNITFIKANVNIKEPFFNDLKEITSIDYIFHYAALVGVERTIKNPNLVFDDIDGIKNIFELAVQKNTKHVFYSSSSEVYGESTKFPQNEDSTPLITTLPYAIVKGFGENYFKGLNKYNVDFSIFRFFNTFGPNQTSDFVMSDFIDKATKNEDIVIYGDGNQTRSFCYIDDNIKVVESILIDNVFTNQIINIGSDEEISIKNLAKLIVKLSDSSSEIIYQNERTLGDMKRRKPDITKMKNILTNLTSIEEGIAKSIYGRRSNK